MQQLLTRGLVTTNTASAASEGHEPIKRLLKSSCSNVQSTRTKTQDETATNPAMAATPTRRAQFADRYKTLRQQLTGPNANSSTASGNGDGGDSAGEQEVALNFLYFPQYSYERHPMLHEVEDRINEFNFSSNVSFVVANSFSARCLF